MSDGETANPGAEHPQTDNAFSADRWHQHLLRFLWRPAVTLWGSIGMLALYVLSFEPVYWLMWKVPYPEWAVIGIGYLYSPIWWATSKSDSLGNAEWNCRRLWLDPNTVSATPFYDVPLRDEPLFFTEIASTIIFAWVIWNFVRWVNQRGLARS
jgi:hypothetical protein